MNPSPTTQQTAARDFVAFWTGKGYEKGQTQPFWLSLLRDVLGVEHPERFIEFEDKAHIDTRHGFIDGYIPSTRVMVEQKSAGKSLTSGIVQADGSVLTPFQQAKRYCLDLPVSRHPRWIVTSNFESFLVYDMERPNAEPERILLQDLPRECYRLAFLTRTEAEYIKREEEVSKNAGAIVGRIYDAFLARYANPENPATLESLNQLCVRLVFLWYCEDADVFTHGQFADYLKRFPARDARRALLDLFKVLDTPKDRRDPYLDADLAAFPYTNGGLFAREDLEVPQLTDDLLSLIVKEGSGFDWREISPTIFGSVFESTLNPETRRQGGMHYTTTKSIHKVIDPLFLDRLTRELDRIAAEPEPRKRAEQAEAYIVRLSRLRFLDPAAGSGNFLTESYICLRRLENRALQIKFDAMRRAGMYQSEMNLGEGFSIRVSIKQFFGIEINGFARAVATSAMFIAELKMQKETEAVLSATLPALPLRDYEGMILGNALRMDWAEICPEGFNFIFGNPPFIGYSNQTEEQKADMLATIQDERGKPCKDAGKIDYVAAWYWKAAEYMEMRLSAASTRPEGRIPACRVAFVSTNSITQGEQVAPVFRPLVERYGFTIDFAHRTFVWNSDSDNKAHVHCVIVGFSVKGSVANVKMLPLPKSNSQLETGNIGNGNIGNGNIGNGNTPTMATLGKPLFDGDRVSYVPHINAYLLPAPDVFVESRSKPLCDVPEMVYGSKPVDGGNLANWTPEHRAEVLASWPQAEPLFRRITGSDEYINGVERWCLWLDGANPALVRSVPPVMEAIAAVREMRLASAKAATRKLADTPTLFAEIRQPVSGNYIVVPRVSSERRRYVPLGFLDSRTICNDLVNLIPSATLYHFGVLTSNVHMAWMRAVAGRLEMRYRYSAKIVYNNFPWPDGTCRLGDIRPGQVDESASRHVTAISATAQAILDARAKYQNASLADLYDELTMPPDLRKAHQDNDRAVMAAYGFKVGMTESECVAELFKRYRALEEEKGR